MLDRYQIGIGQSLTIGRNESNDIIIDNLAVSANHARIESVSASFIIKDLQSTNGTFVNEKLVSAHGLRHNDIILIGKHTLLFDRSDLDQQIEQQKSDTLDEKTRYLDKLVDASEASAENIRFDVRSLIRIFYDALGGARFYSRQPQAVKDICCGLRHSLIARRFRTAGRLRCHLETFEWEPTA